MSFAKDSKLEIIENMIEDAGNATAFLSGFLHSAGQINKNSDGLRVDIITDFKEVFPFVEALVKQLYGAKLDLEISDDYIINKTTYYRIKFPVEITMQVLKDVGMMDNQEMLNLGGEIDQNVVADDECKKHFVKAPYLYYHMNIFPLLVILLQV